MKPLGKFVIHTLINATGNIIKKIVYFYDQ